MTKLLKQAVATARTLPPDLQDEMAHLMLRFAGEEADDPRTYTDDRGMPQDADDKWIIPLVAEAIEAAERGEVISFEEFRARNEARFAALLD